MSLQTLPDEIQKSFDERQKENSIQMSRLAKANSHLKKRLNELKNEMGDAAENTYSFNHAIEAKFEELKTTINEAQKQ